MERVARREPWLMGVKPWRAAERAYQHEATAGPTRMAWRTPTRMRPPAAGDAHVHAWGLATQCRGRQTGRQTSRSSALRCPRARPPPFRAAASHDRAGR
eukprot:3967521-Prymnesium_polylepis.1